MTFGLAYLIGAYLIGSLCTGWFLVRVLASGDLRRLGSGTVGARNAGRILGPAGFVGTLIGDVGKGAVVVGLGQIWGLEPAFIAAALGLVIAGHIWPIFLGFHGGKGIATLMGALGALDLRLLGLLLVVWGVAFLVVRHGSLAGLLAIATLPVLGLVAARLPALPWPSFLPAQTSPSSPVLVALLFVVATILVAHVSNIREYLVQLAAKRAAQA